MLFAEFKGVKSRLKSEKKSHKNISDLHYKRVKMYFKLSQQLVVNNIARIEGMGGGTQFSFLSILFFHSTPYSNINT